MAPGVTLAVIGAILALAVRTDPPGIDLRVVGLILLAAGVGLILHSRRGSTHERVVTRERGSTNPKGLPGSADTDRTTIRDRDRD